MARAKVLVADDNPLVLRILDSALLSLGCDVVTATDGADALLKTLEVHPNLIFSDYDMPIMDGTQLYRKLQGYPAHRDVPFVLLASRSDFETKIRQLDIVPEERIEKPFYVADVKRRAKSMLARLQQHRLESMPLENGVMAGRLEDMSPIDLIQSLEIGRKSGSLTLERQREFITLYFQDGQIYDAEADNARGDVAVYRVLAWNEGEFRIDFRAQSERHSVNDSTQNLLIEGLRRMDEARVHQGS